jgi:hypothetical protein
MAWQDSAGYGKVWHGSARSGKAWAAHDDETFIGADLHGAVWFGTAWLGEARPGVVWHGKGRT